MRSLAPFPQVIQQSLTNDRTTPSKHSHMASRFLNRLCDERGYAGRETVVKDAVQDWKQRQQKILTCPFIPSAVCE